MDQKTKLFPIFEHNYRQITAEFGMGLELGTGPKYVILGGQ